jgi:hypothetical protein
MPNFEPYTVRQLLTQDQSGGLVLLDFQGSVVLSARLEMPPRPMLSELA